MSDKRNIFWYLSMNLKSNIYWSNKHIWYCSNQIEKCMLELITLWKELPYLCHTFSYFDQFYAKFNRLGILKHFFKFWTSYISHSGIWSHRSNQKENYRPWSVAFGAVFFVELNFQNIYFEFLVFSGNISVCLIYHCAQRNKSCNRSFT